MLRIAYLKTRKGRKIGDVGIQEGSDAGADIIVLAEPIERIDSRQTHPSYEVAYRLRDLTVYVSKEVEVSVKGNGEWVLIGDTVAAAYIHPQQTAAEVVRKMNAMAGRAKPWKIQKAWAADSDHCMIGVKVAMERREIKRKETDWAKVEQELRGLAEEWTRDVRLCGRSKRWWKKEWKELRRRSRRSKEARKELVRKVKEAKMGVWYVQRKKSWQRYNHNLVDDGAEREEGGPEPQRPMVERKRIEGRMYERMKRALKTIEVDNIWVWDSVR
ncbi:hypothetical protein EV426DRAFT_720163 [Tirmania nivea]|nr:hypothetical protein EV426DRAFT_720163 [Tirmania nivea]